MVNMELKVFSKENREVGKKKLPKQFSEPSRADIIKRAVEAIFGNRRQKYGVNPRAGKRHSAYVSKKRRRFRGVYGSSRSRTPKKVLSQSGMQFNWVGAFAPNARGGHRAHPPKAEKSWACKINIKERKKAIRSALASALNKSLVVKRGHNVPGDYPFIISNDFENISKTKDFRSALLALGLKPELDRASRKSIRAGKGTLRGRPYKKAKGPLVVVSGNCDLIKSAKNVAGVDVVDVKKLNAELLAPGCIPGRLALFSEQAVDLIEKEGLFS